MNFLSHAREYPFVIALAMLLLLLAPLHRMGKHGKKTEEQLRPTVDLFMVSVTLLILLGIMSSDLRYTPFGRLANSLFIIVGGVGILMYREIQAKFRDDDRRAERAHRRQVQSGPQGSQTSQRSGAYSQPPPLQQKETYDPYKALGLTSGASRQEVSSRYRELVNQFHPDKLVDAGPDLRKIAHERMLEIQKAYEILKRKK